MSSTPKLTGSLHQVRRYVMVMMLTKKITIRLFYVQVKSGEPLTDEIVREYAPRLRFLPRAASPRRRASADDM